MNRPKDSKFRQQRLPAWQPILSPGPVILFFFLVGVVFVPLGVVLVTTSMSVQEYSVRYDKHCRSCNEAQTNCTLTEYCSFSLPVDKDMKAPVYLYYKLDNFYQNHRRYVKSRDDVQLRGVVKDSVSAYSGCDPLIARDPNNSTVLGNVYQPCGLIAWSVFNDTIDTPGNASALYDWTEKGIAWPSDVNAKFKRPADTAGLLPPPNWPFAVGDYTNEHFIVWMRTAALPQFRKLYAVLHKDVPAGKFDFRVHNRYPVWPFAGEKHLVLSTMSWAGGANPFLGYCYVVVGGVSLIQALFFLIRHLFGGRKAGDVSYLRWRSG